jgi:hypothetical protein
MVQVGACVKGLAQTIMRIKQLSWRQIWQDQAQEQEHRWCSPRCIAQSVSGFELHLDTCTQSRPLRTHENPLEKILDHDGKVAPALGSLGQLQGALKVTVVPKVLGGALRKRLVLRGRGGPGRA